MDCVGSERLPSLEIYGQRLISEPSFGMGSRSFVELENQSDFNVDSIHVRTSSLIERGSRPAASIGGPMTT
jgi:hypothetical protein